MTKLELVVIYLTRKKGNFQRFNGIGLGFFKRWSVKMKRNLLLCYFGLFFSLSVTTVYAQDAFLKVVGGGGLSGSSDNTVPIYFRNEKYINRWIHHYSKVVKRGLVL